MGFLDRAKKLIAKNDEQVKKVIDKAADVADKRTKGKHHDKIENIAEKASKAVEDLPEK